MSATEQRRAQREATFQLADVQVAGRGVLNRVKVRNLSDMGMMGEGRVNVVPGSRIVVTLNDLEPIDGAVAWVQQDRFGVAFDEKIDAAAVLKV